MRHYAAPEFGRSTNLAVEVRVLPDKAFVLLRSDPHHPSLRFKKAGGFWSARVGLRYRVLGAQVPDGVLWFWIGTHAEYDAILG